MTKEEKLNKFKGIVVEILSEVICLKKDLIFEFTNIEH